LHHSYGGLFHLLRGSTKSLEAIRRANSLKKEIEHIKVIYDETRKRSSTIDLNLNYMENDSLLNKVPNSASKKSFKSSAYKINYRRNIISPFIVNCRIIVCNCRWRRSKFHY